MSVHLIAQLVDSPEKPFDEPDSPILGSQELGRHPSKERERAIVFYNSMQKTHKFINLWVFFLSLCVYLHTLWWVLRLFISNI